MIKIILTLLIIIPTSSWAQPNYLKAYYPALDSAHHYNRVGDLTNSLSWYQKAFESEKPLFEDLKEAALLNIELDENESAREMLQTLISRWGYDILRVKATLISQGYESYLQSLSWMKLKENSKDLYDNYLKKNTFNPKVEYQILSLTSRLGESKELNKQIINRFKRLITLYDGWPSRELIGNQAFPFAIALCADQENRVEVSYFQQVLYEACKLGKVPKKHYDTYLIITRNIH